MPEIWKFSQSEKLQTFQSDTDFSAAEGKMTYQDVYQAFQSWRSYALHFDAWHTIKAMEHLYNQLFIYCPDQSGLLLCLERGKKMISVILNNGHVLNPESITLEPHMVFSLTDWDQFIEVVDQLEGDNLLHVQVVKDDAPVANFTDCELVGTQTVNNHDGTMTAHFYLIGVPEAQTNPDYETAYKIMTGEVQA